MKETDIVQALRCCAYWTRCEKCPARNDPDCIDANDLRAADAIERLTAENAELREKVPQWISVEPSRLRELADADKDGRVVVLPCNGYSDIEIVRNGISYKPDHWNIHLTAFAHGQNTPSGLKVGLFDIVEVERAMEEMEAKKDGKT